MERMKTIHKGIFKSVVYVVLMLCMVGFTGCEQGDDLDIDDNGLCLVEIDGQFENVPLDEAPLYLNGGTEGYLQDIYGNLKYPAQAREDGIEGTCITTYEITTTGSVENITVIQDPGGGIGAEVLGVFNTIFEGVPFSPGMIDGNPVRVKKEVPIKFTLEG